MSAWELAGWAKFEEDFGPLTLHERIDALLQVTTGKPVQWRSQGNPSADLRWMSMLKAGS